MNMDILRIVNLISILTKKKTELWSGYCKKPYFTLTNTDKIWILTNMDTIFDHVKHFK